MSTTKTEKLNEAPTAAPAETKKKAPMRTKSALRNPTYVELLLHKAGKLLDEESKNVVENFLSKK